MRFKKNNLRLIDIEALDQAMPEFILNIYNMSQYTSLLLLAYLSGIVRYFIFLLLFVTLKSRFLMDSEML